MESQNRQLYSVYPGVIIAAEYSLLASNCTRESWTESFVT
jgi:hypothetical protein